MKRAVLFAVVCVSLSACVSIPSDGSVRVNDADIGQSNPLFPVLQGPEANATPRAIAQGFLNAAPGGSVSGFDVAREFLSSTASAGWDPLAEVTIFDSRAVVLAFDDASNTFTYRVPVAGQLDASGVLVEAVPDATRDIELTVTTDEEGRYRVTGLDDGIVMSAADFARFYRPVPLYFVAADGTTMVPELRWFPDNDQIATPVVRELVEGPSLWLADAVTTGFPPGATLAVDAVVVADGVATVALAPGSAGSAAQRSLAGEQLRLTLGSIPSVQTVVTTVGDLPLDGDGSASLDEPPLPPERAAVIAEGRLGYWDGEVVTVTPAAAGGVPEGAFGLALAYDMSEVALVVNGDVVSSTALAEATTLEEPVPLGEGETLGEVASTVVLDGIALVAPSYDAYGWLWSTESASTGVVLAAGEDGVIELSAPWLAGRPVQAIAVSRDGARVAALSRAGGEQLLEVMAVVRDDEGRPLSLGQPLAVDPSLGLASDLVWVDSLSVAALGEEAGEIALVTVGGWTLPTAPVAGAVAVTARNGARTLLAVDGEGMLAVGSGNGWTVKPIAVGDVAFAG